MGNDMFNDEQLAHAKAQTIQYDPACVGCRQDAAKDKAGTTWQCAGHVRAERDWLRARLANVMAEAAHDIPVLTAERNLATARRRAETWLAEHDGAAWCADVVPIVRSLLAATEPAPAVPDEALARFGALLLPLWWDDGNPGDIDGGLAQDAAEACGLWHQVEKHAEGVECEWCGNEGPCGELTEAGVAFLAARGGRS